MKLWRAVYLHHDEGTCYAWATSKAEASKAWSKMHVEMGTDYVPERRLEQVNIPTTSAALAEWLTVHFNRNNG